MFVKRKFVDLFLRGEVGASRCRAGSVKVHILPQKHMKKINMLVPGGIRQSPKIDPMLDPIWCRAKSAKVQNPFPWGPPNFLGTLRPLFSSFSHATEGMKLQRLFSLEGAGAP